MTVMPLIPGEYVLVPYAEQVLCPECRTWGDRFAVCLEAVITDDGDLLGIDGVVRFETCGHRVPRSSADPAAIAAMLDDMHEEEP